MQDSAAASTTSTERPTGLPMPLEAVLEKAEREVFRRRFAANLARLGQRAVWPVAALLFALTLLPALGLMAAGAWHQVVVPAAAGVLAAAVCLTVAAALWRTWRRHPDRLTLAKGIDRTCGWNGSLVTLVAHGTPAHGPTASGSSAPADAFLSIVQRRLCAAATTTTEWPPFGPPVRPWTHGWAALLVLLAVIGFTGLLKVGSLAFDPWDPPSQPLAAGDRPQDEATPTPWAPEDDEEVPADPEPDEASRTEDEEPTEQDPDDTRTPEADEEEDEEEQASGSGEDDGSGGSSEEEDGDGNNPDEEGEGEGESDAEEGEGGDSNDDPNEGSGSESDSDDSEQDDGEQDREQPAEPEPDSQDAETEDDPEPTESPEMPSEEEGPPPGAAEMPDIIELEPHELSLEPGEGESERGTFDTYGFNPDGEAGDQAVPLEDLLARAGAAGHAGQLSRGLSGADAELMEAYLRKLREMLAERGRGSSRE